MKIAYISAGAAGRYCGACLHDNTLAAELHRQGADILLVPTYTPLRTDEPSASGSRVFFGGVNVFLQQHSALFRHTPWFLDSLLDSPKLLEWLSARSAGMDVSKLGALTVSTLAGRKGRQRKEIAKLIRWLAGDVRPDVVHLSNVMLAGMAPAVREELRVPIVCTLSGEDIFLEQLSEPHYSQARALLKQQAQYIDRFVALNRYFADFMADYLEVDRGKIEVIPHGLNLSGHHRRQPREIAAEITVGYFARVAMEKGLHILADAFCLLANRADMPPLRLHVAGYMSSGDRPYFEQVTRRLTEAGLADRFEYHGELDRAGKIAFLQSLDVMSVPTVYHESKGISVLEGMASGVPMVLPSHGTFPELIERSGGGLLCDPLDPRSLADKLAELIRDPALAMECGRRGHELIHGEHSAALMARRHRALYERVLGERAGGQGSAIGGRESKDGEEEAAGMLRKP
ncbi:MAG TPA: glycosyltransferase family 4 protein [Pirellulales bacterium]|jgi:glycosyltransferase involved in cell wall biosynthesis|nr:glycosyltransferase family 4 protein [Pirellulales bacterium]